MNKMSIDPFFIFKGSRGFFIKGDKKKCILFYNINVNYDFIAQLQFRISGVEYIEEFEKNGKYEDYNDEITKFYEINDLLVDSKKISHENVPNYAKIVINKDEVAYLVIGRYGIYSGAPNVDFIQYYLIEFYNPQKNYSDRFNTSGHLLSTENLASTYIGTYKSVFDNCMYEDIKDMQRVMVEKGLRQ